MAEVLLKGGSAPPEAGQARLPRTAEPGSTGAGVFNGLIGDLS